MFKMTMDSDAIMAIMKFIPEVVWHVEINTYIGTALLHGAWIFRSLKRTSCSHLQAQEQGLPQRQCPPPSRDSAQVHRRRIRRGSVKVDLQSIPQRDSGLEGTRYCKWIVSPVIRTDALAELVIHCSTSRFDGPCPSLPHLGYLQETRALPDNIKEFTLRSHR